MSGPDLSAPKNADFQTVEYWDKRYASEAPDADFDWFRKYSDIRDIINELVPDRLSRILMLGCGNSSMYIVLTKALSKDMLDDGYTHILNLDYSAVLIEKMQQRVPELDWRVMDIRELCEHANELGGPGTMDALMAENGSVWNPSEQVLNNVAREVDGQFLYFTFGQPHFRRPHMQREAWDIETRELGDMFHYYLYICRKH